MFIGIYNNEYLSLLYLLLYDIVDIDIRYFEDNEIYINIFIK